MVALKLNILIGGEAGQGINKISEIVSGVLAKQGYFTFNYRDYQSLIRGGHNFNILSVSNSWVASHESKLDGIIALDKKTLELHKTSLKPGGFIISFEEFKKDNLGRNLNVALSGSLIKILGVDKKCLEDEVGKKLGKDSVLAVDVGYKKHNKKFDFVKIDNNIKIKSGSQAVSDGAISSGMDLYVAYPMTPATGVLHYLAGKKEKNSYNIFQPENEISVVNFGLGASFSGARTMVGTSGGGFDLMSEGLSLQGISEIPLVVYLCSRPGPGTGVPTYTSQSDLDIALRSGHGEFPRVVFAPGDPIEAEELTNQAFYFAEKFLTLSIILSDKHLAESEFSLDKSVDKNIKIKINRKIPGTDIVKASSYEHDEVGNTIELASLVKQNSEARLKKYENIKEEAKKFKMIKIYGEKNSKNLVVGWGSTKGAILDAVEDLDCKFLQVIYVKPLSNKIKEEMLLAKKVILVENNLTGQLGRLVREKTGIKISSENRILKYDGRPFTSDELKMEIKKRL